MATVQMPSAWSGSGKKGDPYRPALADSQSLTDWVDLSGTLGGAPGTITIQAEVSDVKLATLQAANIAVTVVPAKG